MHMEKLTSIHICSSLHADIYKNKLMHLIPQRSYALKFALNVCKYECFNASMPQLHEIDLH